jgi:hypothetical protein
LDFLIHGCPLSFSFILPERMNIANEPRGAIGFCGFFG